MIRTAAVIVGASSQRRKRFSLFLSSRTMPFTNAKDAGDFTTYNIHHGFPEGVVRGYRSGFLADGVSMPSDFPALRRVPPLFSWFLFCLLLYFPSIFVREVNFSTLR